MGGGGGEADVIRIGDAAGTGEEIAVTQDIWTLLRWFEQVFSPGRAFQDLVLWGVGLLTSLNLTGEIDDELERDPLGLKPTVAVCSRPKSKTKGPSSAAFASEEIWFVGASGINQPALAAQGLDASLEPLKDCSRGTRLS